MPDIPPQHLSIRPLNYHDVELCLELEAKGFPENERCTREKFLYRLTNCPELCSGLFVREFEEIPVTTDADDYKPPAKSTVTSEKLIGHAIGTKMYDDKVTERSMEIPVLDKDGDVDTSIEGNAMIGHVESSKNIGLHSLVVDPEYRGLKMGTLLLRDYIQKLSHQEIGERLAIIVHQRLTGFYSNLGFINEGTSKCQFGNGGWIDMACPLIHEEDDV